MAADAKTPIVVQLNNIDEALDARPVAVKT
jgi:hypothetical protein